MYNTTDYGLQRLGSKFLDLFVIKDVGVANLSLSFPPSNRATRSPDRRRDQPICKSFGSNDVRRRDLSHDGQQPFVHDLVVSRRLGYRVNGVDAGGTE